MFTVPKKKCGFKLKQDIAYKTFKQKNNACRDRRTTR